MIEFYRPGTDDDRFVIPEIVTQDMYRMAELAKRLSGRKGTILDGGAHIGAASVMFAAHFPDSRVIAYEPEPDSFTLLEKNAAAYPNIRPVKAALGMPGKTVLKLWPQNGTGRHTAMPQYAIGDFISVDVVVLESEIEKNAPVLVLKLDLEGYESYLLNNLPMARFASVEALIIETHPWTGAPLLAERLIDAGLKLWFHPHNDPRHAVYLREDR